MRRIGGLLRVLGLKGEGHLDRKGNLGHSALLLRWMGKGKEKEGRKKNKVLTCLYYLDWFLQRKVRKSGCLPPARAVRKKEERALSPFAHRHGGGKEKKSPVVVKKERKNWSSPRDAKGKKPKAGDVSPRGWGVRKGSFCASLRRRRLFSKRESKKRSDPVIPRRPVEGEGLTVISGRVAQEKKRKKVILPLSVASRRLRISV